MKKSNRRAIGRWALALIGSVLMVFTLIGRTQAQETVLTRTNDLTFSQPVALPGVVLPAGTYTFESVLLGGNVVRVSNRIDGTLKFTGFTRRIERPRGMSTRTAVTFGEATPGTARPISAWFPLGRSEGHQFLYR
jgi:hypothetical protein